MRARCDEGWNTSLNFNQNRGDFVDLELLVKVLPTINGFIGETTDGFDVDIVYKASLASNFINFNRGEKFRLIGALKIKNDQIEVKSWTEIFLL